MKFNINKIVGYLITPFCLFHLVCFILGNNREYHFQYTVINLLMLIVVLLEDVRNCTTEKS